MRGNWKRGCEGFHVRGHKETAALERKENWKKKERSRKFRNHQIRRKDMQCSVVIC